MSLVEYIYRDDTGSDCMARWLTGKQSEPVLYDTVLTLAKEILKKKFFILLTDEMEVSVERLIYYMGWEYKDEYRSCVNENVAKFQDIIKVYICMLMLEQKNISH